MNYTKTIKGNNVLYKIEGNLGYDSIDEIDRLRMDINNTSFKGKYNFIWDFKSCPILSEPGIAAIILCVSITMKTNKKTFLCGLNRENLEMIKSFDLDKQVVLLENTKQALGIEDNNPEILNFSEKAIKWI